MTAFIGRREFITLLGGAAAWPLAARAQQPERVRQIGVFMRLSESDPVTKGYLTALSGGLAPLGWSENRNLQFEKRLTGGDDVATNTAAAAPDACRTSTQHPAAAVSEPNTSRRSTRGSSAPSQRTASSRSATCRTSIIRAASRRYRAGPMAACR